MESLERRHHQVPFDELVSIARSKLSELIPEFADASDSEKDKITELFVGDMLAERNIRGSISFHRFSAEQQQAALKAAGIESPANLFDSPPSESLIDFYRSRITNGPRASFDPLTDPSVE